MARRSSSERASSAARYSGSRSWRMRSIRRAGYRSLTGRPDRGIRIHRRTAARVDLEVEVGRAARVAGVADLADLLPRTHATGPADVRLEVRVEVRVAVAAV